MNFSGLPADVVQIQIRDFRCPVCNQEGANGIVIRSNGGEDIDIYGVDPSTGRLVKTDTIEGFKVGRYCLDNAGVDIKECDVLSVHTYDAFPQLTTNPFMGSGWRKIPTPSKDS